MNFDSSIHFDGKQRTPFRASTGLDKPKTIGIFDKMQEISQYDEIMCDTDREISDD
jgi:hypothetical protein